MGSVISYLACGCAILADGGRTFCPTCAEKLIDHAPLSTLDELAQKLERVCLYCNGAGEGWRGSGYYGRCPQCNGKGRHLTPLGDQVLGWLRSRKYAA